MQVITLLVHVLLAISLVALVLLQQGKGAEAGAAFGGGASQTVFGSRGSSSFLAKLTGVLAAVFFATSVGLAWYANNAGSVPISGIPDASLIERQHSGVPVLDDAPAQGLGSADPSEAPLTAPEAAPSQNQNAPALDDQGQGVDNAAPALEGSEEQ
ncbi:preprotein translocase subunit SecG [Halotalea alkalilenta]|uniref:Protein-export membrane protein SecG n=1 Tax=Halotalea alkalilenta TaxID=376489 RepID=A0A172YJL3_9GAMM|nr:preprotein translocase subunit SecG [Halotalea alkalilenta]ANF59399.1 hypothetical protein A5892_00150 [Halotalea alkalilenta]